MKIRFLALLLLLVGPFGCTKPTDPVDPEKEKETEVDADPVWDVQLGDRDIQVWGDLVDIRDFRRAGQIYPQYDTLDFAYDVDELGYSQYAVGLRERKGPEWVRAGKDASIVVASECSSLESADWQYTGKSFSAGDLTYHIHEYVGAGQTSGVKIPRPEGTVHSVMVLGGNLSVSGTPEYGDCVIAQTSAVRGEGIIEGPGIIIMPDGSYLATCRGADGNTGPSVYGSTDRGKTWSLFCHMNRDVNKVSNFFSLFLYEGKPYIIGHGIGGMNLYIIKSDDGGHTWTVPTSSSNGVLLTGVAIHSSQVPTLESNGRIWRACEIGEDSGTALPFMMSAEIGSDILDASNWSFTKTFTKTKFWHDRYHFNGLLEGNAVAGPDGRIYDLCRTNCNSQTSAYAVRLVMDGLSKLDFAEEDAVVEMPGGGVKFTVLYDQQTKKYWSLTNPDTDYPKDGKIMHEGHKLFHGEMRNRLALISSPDLIHWTVEDNEVLYDKDPFFHGFQYVDWVFDGDDMIAVIRAGYPEVRGLPARQHDANKLIFLRVKDFRNRNKS